MTKKKMIICVLVGIFALYSCAVGMIFLGAQETAARSMHDCYNYIQQLSLAQYLENSEPDFAEIHKDIHLRSPMYSTASKPGYAYAFFDKDKNIIFKSSSTVWYYEFDTGKDYYIPLEEYMTPQIKEEILSFQNESRSESIRLTQMEVNLHSGVCQPVSLTFTDGQKSKTFVISGLIRTHTLLEADGNFACCLYDLDEKSLDHYYYLKALQKVEDNIEKGHYTKGTNYSGGGGVFDFTGGEIGYDEVYEGYHFVMCIRFNSAFETITSDVFGYLLSTTTFLFAVVGLIIMIFALKTFNKNQKLKENQRAFTSAVAHEMKTPLAVIQNQCECIMDGVAPEKNEQYVRSVYDEAQKMNGMVQTFLMFNRLSDMVRLKAERCCLSEIVLSEIGKYESFASAKSVSFNADVAPDVFADGNAELLAIAVGNYLSNAVRYSTGEAEIDIKLEADGKSFTFSVYNNGEPIEASEDIWSVLTRGDASRNGSDGSSGMGLPICKRIFELHKMEYGYAYEENRVKFYFKGKVI